MHADMRVLLAYVRYILTRVLCELARISRLARRALFAEKTLRMKMDGLEMDELG